MSAVEVLREARTFLAEPSHWHKGDMDSKDGSASCALGALERATCEVGRWQAEEALELHLPGGLQQYLEHALVPVAAFNDDPATTHQDVLDLFDKTLADLGGL